MKRQNDYFKPIEKGTLEDAVQQIWNEESTIIDEGKALSGKEVAKRMRTMKKYSGMSPFAGKVEKLKIVTRKDLEKILPEYIGGGAITQILKIREDWNGDTITEAPDDLEMVTLDFDKMSEFKKARNYLDKNGISPPGYGGGGGAQYDFDRDMYGDELSILNIDDLHPRIKMKTKRDVENFLKKGRFKLDIRYIGPQ